MDFRILFIVSVAVLLNACGVKKEDTSKKGVHVVITINNSIPHCGGAAPLPDDNWPKIAPLSGCQLSVHTVNEDGSRGMQIATLTTDEEGKAKLVLPKGNYQLWALNKLEKFGRFVELESEVKSTHYTYKDLSCFQEWYDRADFDLEVGEKTEFGFMYKKRCFIGTHPCLIYSGPYPP